jgi:S-adenosylmethionine hydrolase
VKRTSTIITLTTDFGNADGFQAAMKAVILRWAPDARIVDITHGTPPQNVAHASFVLGSVAPYFDAGAIHIAVVDPGVGGDRAAIVIEKSDGTRYVGPDNGIFTRAIIGRSFSPGSSLEQEYLAPLPGPLPEGFRAFRIEAPEAKAAEVSTTFHGRDVFATSAAAMTAGLPPEDAGPPLETVQWLNLPGPQVVGQAIEGRIQHIDHFGNLAADIPGRDDQPELLRNQRPVFKVGKTIVSGLSGSYEAARGVGCLVGSHGFFEIFITGSNAAGELAVKVGDRVSLH